MGNIRRSETMKSILTSKMLAPVAIEQFEINEVAWCCIVSQIPSAGFMSYLRAYRSKRKRIG